MNCNNFQSIADELARGRLMDAAQREDAHAHADACAPCAARLADGRALTAGLRTLSAQTDGQAAPARVESALLAAFRQRHATASQRDTSSLTTTAAATVVAPLAAGRRGVSLWRLPRWAQGAAVAAASVLLVVGLYGIFREQSASPETRLAQTGAQKSEAAPERKQEAEAAAARPVEGGGATGVVEAESADVDEPEQRETEASTPRRAKRATGARTNVQLAKFDSAGARRPADTTAVANTNAPAEIATDFFPLMNGGQLAPGDSGHVIRVEVPRTALASFGLPVNADRAGGRVKADVLMGDDGMARAIRFVH